MIQIGTIWAFEKLVLPGTTEPSLLFGSPALEHVYDDHWHRIEEYTQCRNVAVAGQRGK